MEDIRKLLQKLSESWDPVVQMLQHQASQFHGELADPIKPHRDRIRQTFGVSVDHVQHVGGVPTYKVTHRGSHVGHIHQHDNGMWFATGPNGEFSHTQTEYHEEPHKAVRALMDVANIDYLKKE
jgi:1,2-phenylacetyl-CoA epoxidase catalytic subunit